MKYHMEESLTMPLGTVLGILQNRIMTRSTYFGIRTLMSPLDYWVYQEMLYEARPDVIIEIGNLEGGGTLSLAHICDLIGHGRVIGIDVSHSAVSEIAKSHERITFITGDACEVFAKVKELISETETVFIIEDSSHTYENTLKVLRTYSGLIKPGDYIVVEDGICHHGISEGPIPGPYEAVEQFVKENPAFEVDRDKESFLITWNPKGYLKRITGMPVDRTSLICNEIPTKSRFMIRDVLKLFVPPIIVQLVKAVKNNR